MRAPSVRMWNLLRWGCIVYFALLGILTLDDMTGGALNEYLGLHCGGGCFRVYSDWLGGIITPEPTVPSVHKIDGGWYIRAFFVAVFVGWFKYINETRPAEYKGEEEKT